MRSTVILDRLGVILAGSLILVEDGTTTEIATALVPLAEIIEDYCGEKVSTILQFDKDSQKIRFQFSRNRYIEFETIEQNVYDEESDKYYHILRLSNLSHLSRNSLVIRVMFDIFNWK